jgi:hypothetical protein
VQDALAVAARASANHHYDTFAVAARDLAPRHRRIGGAVAHRRIAIAAGAGTSEQSRNHRRRAFGLAAAAGRTFGTLRLESIAPLLARVASVTIIRDVLRVRLTGRLHSSWPKSCADAGEFNG